MYKNSSALRTADNASPDLITGKLCSLTSSVLLKEDVAVREQSAPGKRGERVDRARS